MGLFEQPLVDPAQAAAVLADRSHRETARLAAERAAVLLRNDGGVLPLKAGSLKSLAVIGPLADAPRETLGPWVFDFALDETVSILAGIRAKAGVATEVQYAPALLLPARKHPSPFAMLPGNSPARPKGFDEKGEFDKAVRLAGASRSSTNVFHSWHCGHCQSGSVLR